MTVRLPDVPRMADPGLSELLQAMRREMIALDARNEALALAAGATVPLPPQFDNSLQIANTAWVKRFGHQFSARYIVSVSTVLTAAYVGGLVQPNGNALTLTLPSGATIQEGAMLRFFASADGVRVVAAGTGSINMGPTNVTSVTLNFGDTLELTSNGAGVWLATGGSAQLFYSGYRRVRPYRQVTVSDVIKVTDLGGVVQPTTAGINLTLPDAALQGWGVNGFGATVEIINFPAINILGTAGMPLLNANTGALLAAAAPIAVLGANRVVCTSAAVAWWVEIAR